MRMIEAADGVRLRTWTTGTATDLPAVVLLHGGPGLGDHLEPVARMLAPSTVVHRFDQRGCGGSGASADQTVDRTVADVEALRRHWGHDAWVVLGHSFGATLVLAYAVAHPGRTRAVGYLSGVGVGDWRTAAYREQARRRTPAQQQRLARLEEQAARPWADEVEFRALSWFPDFADPEQGWAWALADARTPQPINYAANRALMADSRRRSDAEVLDRVRHLDMPCWFLHGDRDPRPAANVAELAAAIPGARFHRIPGAGHQPWRERPAACADLLRALVVSAAGDTAVRPSPAVPPVSPPHEVLAAQDPEEAR